MSSYKFDEETLLRLITLSNTEFDKKRNEFEYLYLGQSIISSNIPIEFQKEEILWDKEFTDRYLISTGIVSTALIKYLLYKNANNNHNTLVLEAVKNTLFENMLKIRDNLLKKSETSDSSYSILSNCFIDDETKIEKNEQNFKLFSKTIDEISNELVSFINENGDSRIYNYFGWGFGQIMPRTLDEKFYKNKVGELIKSTINKITVALQRNFFEQLDL